MNLPAEFVGRVFKTRFVNFLTSYKIPPEIQKDFPDIDIDVIYENTKPIVVLVFETTEDCLAFTLKYGKEYV